MNDEFVNRLARHRKVLTYLDLPANQPLWSDLVPKIFTSTVAQLRAAVDSFGAAGAAQSAPVSWEQQNREERELEDHAFPLSNALYDVLLDAGREAEAAEWRMTETDWRKLREQLLLDKAQRLLDQLAAALAATPTVADDYGISTARIAALTQEWQDYAEVIGEPGARKATRAGLTGSLRARMRVLDGLAEKMDRLIVSFRGTPEGKAMVAGYFAARRVDDLGHGPHTPPPGPPTP
jgi:hypothetical protein